MTKFEKVSYKQYISDLGFDPREKQMSIFDEALEYVMRKEYDEIILPHRSTQCSAGYDFFAPYDVSIAPGDSCTIYSGIRVIMPPDRFLAVYPRSGLGIKYRVTLANSTGIIDADYKDANNEGHIIIKLVNDGTRTVDIRKGSAFAQGIFQAYFLTDDDAAFGKRTGGLGSTDSGHAFRYDPDAHTFGDPHSK